MTDAKKKSFAQISNAEYIEEIYQQYLKDAESVDSSWKSFFEGMEFAQEQPLSCSPETQGGDLNVYRLIEAYRSEGYKVANISPLELKPKKIPESLRLESYGLEFSQEVVNTHGILEGSVPLQELVERLERIYCSRIGFEYKHLDHPELIKFIEKRVESHFEQQLNAEQKKRILSYLNKAELFESFMHTKFVGQKRFSLEGLETFIPVVRSILDHGGEYGVDEIVLCMAHRGRLSLLTNIFERPYKLVFHEFEESYEPSSFEGSGDVKYHKGYSADIENDHGNRIHISIPPNSSHLESVNSIMLGQVKAKQVHKNDKDQTRILGIQVHGDASVAGQGVIYETMQMNKINGYEVGGSIHIILDNQVGFTALPEASRSTLFPSDIAKTFGCPVFHVNAEDPNGCVLVTQLAVEIRQKFKCDVFIHLCGYRKYGHNEGDEPSYTQPLEYQMIRKKDSIRKLYVAQLIDEKVLTEQEVLQKETEFRQSLQKELEQVKSSSSQPLDENEVLGNRWSFWKDHKLKSPGQIFEAVVTEVSQERLKALAVKMTEIPKDFTPHRKVAQLLSMRRAAVLGDPDHSILDWGLVETLAYASLLSENFPIRIAGQDSRRGTFSHRHAALIDQKNAKDYYPLNHLQNDQAKLSIYDSLLSEYGGLGFEYGYSISTPQGLVIWEAQFGDFANGAQIITDAYIANAEEKWNRLSDLTMMLPHGYEGQGPEHSSARIERFLQLAGENNMILINPTTPAQLFHALRRQVLKSYRKPLVIFTPKALLRHKRCTSSVNELSSGHFEYIKDDPESLENIERLIFCSGRIFYDLLQRREELASKKVALVRIEQIYPLDQEGLKQIVDKYRGFKECLWVQEEPQNMGCWYYIKSLLKETLQGADLRYVGRDRQASTATGSHRRHKESLEAIIKQAFEGVV